MRKNFKSKPAGFYALSLLILFSCLSLCACWVNSSAQTNPQADYDAAVQDAKTMTAAKISKNLTSIRSDNANLQWENNVAGSRVLVATYVDNPTACANYLNPANPCRAGQECTNYGFNSWVTVIPELKNYLGNAPSLLRVAQSLGLPPPATGLTLENTCIIELYVSPSNLFRPSPDPEITDQEAELTFPLDGFRKFDDTVLIYSDMLCNVGDARCPNRTGSGKCGMTSYRNWFDIRREKVYSATPPYPWTALGYTYDWGNPVSPHMGVSEFVINSGAAGISVFIKSMTWTGAYFAN